MFEIEKKAHLSHPEKTLWSIQKLPHTVYIGDSHKQDLYFTKHKVINYKDLKLQKDIFRIRTIGEDIYITLKYKQLVGNTEVNQELDALVKPENKIEIMEIFKHLGLEIDSQIWEYFLSLVKAEEWISFWEQQGFFYLLSKEKKTKLFTVQEEDKIFSIEWNELVGLGFFLEIEGLTENERDIPLYIRIIDKYMSLLGISSDMEEPKLYLELLFQKKPSQDAS